MPGVFVGGESLESISSRIAGKKYADLDDQEAQSVWAECERLDAEADAAEKEDG